MWVLLHIKTGRRFNLLTDTKKYTVGRSAQSDLSIIDDTSVSREHAVIHRSSSGVRVEDLGSKYGVYVNRDIDKNKPIPAKTLVDLQAGNIVRFGRLENIFRLENIEIKVCTSTMNPDSLERLKTQLKIIDGTWQSVWNTECTHLVMPSVTVTIKVLQSLAYGVPIISPKYWDAYIECARQHKTELPSSKDFIPDITEPYIIKEPGMMDVHLDRQRLFQNKTFVFMVKRHMDQFESIIKLAAGKCVSVSEGKVRKSFLLKNECIPIQYTPSHNSQCSTDIEDVVKYIQKNGRRLISESEIGLAILHRSIDRFCNPDRKMVADFEPESVDPKNIIKDILIEETPQARNTEQPVPSSSVIPESDDLTGTEPNNNLRASDAVDLDKPSTSSPRKSLRLSTRTNVSTNFPSAETSKKQKRKLNDENEQPKHVASEEMDPEQSVPAKKQKTNDEIQGENSSARFIEPMPSASHSQLNFSGFISTQDRRKRLQAQSPVKSPQKRTEMSTREGRKRAIDMLAGDSDDNNDDNDAAANLFNFNRRPKRAKTSKDTQRRILDDNDNDDEDDVDLGGNLFNFAKKRGTARQTQNKQKTTQNKSNEATEIDGHSVDESRNSYKKPFQRSMNRSFNRTTVVPIDIVLAPKCETEWLTTKMKQELNLNEQPESNASTSNSVKVKEEKLEEWEMTAEDKKREWVKSLANVFKVRNIEVNMSRRSVADETDSVFSHSAHTTLNKTKNFKKFVKKHNYIPHTTVIKTIPVPVVVSTFNGI